MSLSSTIQIIKVNEVETGISKKTGSPWERHTAECIILDDDGAVNCVGKLDIPPALRGNVQCGTFRGGFSFFVPTYGNDQGRITARLVSLLPAPVKAAPAASKAASAAHS